MVSYELNLGNRLVQMRQFFTFLTILALLISSVFTGSVNAVEVTPWKFKGDKKWTTLNGKGSPRPVSYAETTVDDDTLSILYDKEYRQWYLQFEYIADGKLVHSNNKKPEFFVRTRDNSNSGRYDTDHVISNEAKVYYNKPGKPQYVIMPISRVDLPHLKVNFNIGVGYYLAAGCAELIEGECIDLGEFRTYLFSGDNASEAISAIERSNNQTVTRATTIQSREERIKEQKENDKIAQILKWYQGDWAQVTPKGPLLGGCDVQHEIDFDQFPKLMQQGKFFGYTFKGMMAISSLGATSHDHLYFSTGYDTGAFGSKKFAPTKKIILFTSQGKQFYRIRLGSEIPGIPYKRVIETDGKFLRLVAWDTNGKDVDPLYFARCE